MVLPTHLKGAVQVAVGDVLREVGEQGGFRADLGEALVGGDQQVAIAVTADVLVALEEPAVGRAVAAHQAGNQHAARRPRRRPARTSRS